MSYILDALKKKQDASAPAPNMTSYQPHYPVSEVEKKHFNWWPLAIVLMLTLAALVGYLWAKVQHPTAELQPRTAAQAPAPSTPAQSDVFQQASALTTPEPKPVVPVVEEAPVVYVQSNAEMQAQENVNVSNDLLAAFEQALAQEGEQTSPEGQSRVFDSGDDHAVTPIAGLPQSLRRLLPAMTYDQHMYASDSNVRYIKINGQTYYEGQWIGSNLQLIEIRQTESLFAIEDELFSLGALTDW